MTYRSSVHYLNKFHTSVYLVPPLEQIVRSNIAQTTARVK